MSEANTATRPSELGNPGYELFIVGLSIVSLANFAIVILPTGQQVNVIAEIVDIPISAIFLIDFTNRLLRSHPRRDYFIGRQGWLDLLGSLPFAQFKIFRLFRVLRVVRLLRAYGARSIFRDVMRRRADNALLIILFVVILLLEFGSMSVLWAESFDPNANIKTGGEALWWAFVSITTVGYGDYTPVTKAGRFLSVLVLAAGVGLFGALSGYLANFFLSPTTAKEPKPPPSPRDPVQLLAELETELTARVEAIREAIRTVTPAGATLDDGDAPTPA